MRYKGSKNQPSIKRHGRENISTYLPWQFIRAALQNKDCLRRLFSVAGQCVNNSAGLRDRWPIVVITSVEQSRQHGGHAERCCPLYCAVEESAKRKKLITKQDHVWFTPFTRRCPKYLELPAIHSPSVLYSLLPERRTPSPRTCSLSSHVGKNRVFLSGKPTLLWAGR